jgi:hypothetical protein
MRAQRQQLDADLINRRWNAATARTVLAAWEASGTSLAGFARENGIGVWRLGWWRKQLEAGASRPVPRATPIAPLTFVPATVMSSGSTRARISVRLPSGIEVEATDASALPVQWLAELVRALGREP